MAKIWGVESAAKATEEFFQCVKNNQGIPKFWGRYLSGAADVSKGLTKQEITFLKRRGIKILPIYNNAFDAAIGYERGRIAARNAVFHARRLGIPKNIVIFVRIERFLEVDEGYIRGWAESLFPSGYRPGFYHDPLTGGFSSAYCEAVKHNPQVADQAILWNAEPQTEASTECGAQLCKGNLWAWRFSRDAEPCPFDAVLSDRKLLQYLF